MLTPAHQAPILNTTHVEAMHLLEQHFRTHRKEIHAWFESQWQLSLPPVYGSVDLRNAGFKIAPIDMNLFPAGFNNLNPAYLSLAAAAARVSILATVPGAKRILILPESHTRNMRYWENMHTLQAMLIEAGFEVRIAMLSADIMLPTTLTLTNGNTLQVEQLERQNDQLCLAKFIPDVVLLNNDLSEGIPDILQQVKTPIIPPAELGWSQRLKSGHFQYYAEVAAEFADRFELDSWLMAPLFRHCGQVDFMQQEGLDCLINNAEILFSAIQHKYTQYNIPYQPFLIVKADAGTYGMAVMTVRNIDELRHLNRKQRTRMSTIKGGQTVSRVIIQEGVYTFESLGQEQAVAEPVVYLWGGCVVGGFYRVHKDRGVDENLNSPGMHFEPLPFAEPCHEPCNDANPDACQNRFYTYGIIALLSTLAAAREIKDLQKS